MSTATQTHPTPTKLVFFGSSQLSATTLEYILTQPQYEVVAVVTKALRPDRSAHKSQADTPVALVAQANHLKLLRPSRAGDAIAELAPLNAAVGLLFAYGQLLPDELIAAFPKGIVNIHPSRLPQHRGPSPIEATLLAGDTIAGTTIMLIAAAMDAGPILAQDQWPIPTDITKSELTNQLLKHSLALLTPTLDGYLAGTIQPHPQDDSAATYCKLIKKPDGLINPSEETVQNLERKVRAYVDWPGVRLPIRYNDKDTLLRLHDIKVIDQLAHQPRLSYIAKQALLNLSDGQVSLERVQLPGKSVITGTDLGNGGRLALQSNTN